MIDIFARAAHAPQSSVRLPAGGDRGARAAAPARGLDDRRSATPSSIACSPTSASRARCSSTSTTRPTSTRARPQAALAGTDISVPPLEAYAGKLWDYWERHLDPDLFRDRTLIGAARGRLGLVGGLGQMIEQQIPDELMRLGRSPAGQRLAREGRPRPGRDGHRRLLGDRQVGGAEDRRRRRHRAAGRAHARRSSRQTREQIEAGGGTRLHPPRRPLRLRRHRPDGRRGARRSTATSTSWSTTPAARSGARSRSPTTARTTSSARSSSTTSARCG